MLAPLQASMRPSRRVRRALTSWWLRKATTLASVSWPEVPPTQDMPGEAHAFATMEFPCEAPEGTICHESGSIKEPIAVRDLVRSAGVVLLRNTGIESSDDFERLLHPVVQPRGGFMNYMGGTNDRYVQSNSGNVLSTGTEPAHLRLREHAEMAYVDRWCSIIAFGCVRPPSDLPPEDKADVSEDREKDDERPTGSTTVARAKDIQANVPRNMIKKLQTTGLQHHFFYHDDNAVAAEKAGGPPVKRYVKSWQSALLVTTRAEAENVCKQNGWSCEWCVDDGALHYWFTRPAYVKSPSEDVPTEDAPLMFVTDISRKWYMDWLPFSDWEDERRPYWHCWGNGERMTMEEDEAWARAERLARHAHRWCKGDVLLIDNLRCLHGRAPCVPGDGRKILVALCEPVSRVVPKESQETGFNFGGVVFSQTFYGRNRPRRVLAYSQDDKYGDGASTSVAKL